ncbi:hypothetical protein Clacol_009591 [Clathrus columnatus]|uniref:Cytochrome P450 n=1 Tax=Clathrus columnatus TaxID=1419009 RepID=A0AAV5ALJ9_9AGAM|nr:hypothetical protein Clacol_009591 [Clathrus columnatus]
MSLFLYFFSLLSSLTIYRLSPFHPLASIPGPRIARLSRFKAMWVAQQEYQHLYYRSLHTKYGPYVRTGPNHIHIADASAVPIVLAAKPFRKSDRYLAFIPPHTAPSLFALVDVKEHSERRKLWERGMNSSALQQYRDIVIRRTQQFVDIVSKTGELGHNFDLAGWFSLLSFDIMGDLAFNGRFQLLKEGPQSEAVKFMDIARQSLFTQECFGMIPWIRQYVNFLPQKNKADVLWVRKFSKDTLEQRMKEGPKMKDLLYNLDYTRSLKFLIQLDEEHGGEKILPLPTLILEAGLTILAGSDTTGTTLSNVFFYLLSNPYALQKLLSEIDNYFSAAEDVYSADLKELKYLNAVLSETLRLAPATPSGSQRVLPEGSTGNGGILIGDRLLRFRWIPEGTSVQIHTYTIHRDPRYFSPDPERFRPERWLEKSLSTDPSAWIPFSYGPANCVGRQLALLELRTVICALLKQFTFKFAPDFNPERWEENIRDHFILAKGELLVQIQARDS